jgi:3D (Asp-Asp-Asp) domain-containing protein
VELEISYYSLEDARNANWTITRSGQELQVGMGAVDERMLARFPYGTRLLVPSKGELITVTIQDTGGGGLDWLDIACESHTEADWRGRHNARVEVLSRPEEKR